jgi:proliferating cell nuclear antigen|tara:strand:- start:637 stop:1422 length:786 start_codon:yes stop_codon:yes gene_type:complete
MPSFHLVFQDGQRFKQIVDLCKDIVSDVSFQIESSGISMQAMDMAHVALVSFFIPKQDFAEYNLFGKENFVISVSLRNLNLILKSYKPGFKLSFAFNDNDKLQIIYNYRPKNVNEDTDEQYTWSLQLIQMENEMLQIPEEEIDATIFMDSAEFHEMLRNVGVFQDTLLMSIRGKVVEFETRGDFGNVVFCKSFSKDTLRSKMSFLQLGYSIKYLSWFSKAYQIAKQVEINLQRESPMEMVYRFGVDHPGFIRFHLAPKFDE